jgi:hypothetical protein
VGHVVSATEMFDSSFRRFLSPFSPFQLFCKAPIKVEAQSADTAAVSHNRGRFCQNLLSGPFTSIAVTFQQWLWLSDDIALIKTTIR